MNVAVLGAGGPAGANVVRSLNMAGHDVIGIDGNPFRLGLIEGTAVKQEYDVYHDRFIGWLNDVCVDYQIRYVHSQPEEGVEVLSRSQGKLVAEVLLPSSQTVVLCQDKFETAWRWKKAGLKTQPVIKLELAEQIVEAIETIGLPLWLRATRGAGARGATLVENYDTALHWWQYWRARGSDWEWILEEFLPGRDFAWTSLWYQGDLIVSQGRERLEYIFPHLAPSGRTGTPTVAVTVSDERVNSAAMGAVLAIDDEPHGLYCVDLREDSGGVPRPTEINAGRFFTTSHFYSAAGLNIPDLCVQFATDTVKGPLPPQFDPLPEGLYWMRHIDCPARLLSLDENGEWVKHDEVNEDPLWQEWWEASRREERDLRRYFTFSLRDE